MPTVTDGTSYTLHGRAPFQSGIHDKARGKKGQKKPAQGRECQQNLCGMYRGCSHQIPIARAKIGAEIQKNNSKKMISKQRKDDNIFSRSKFRESGRSEKDSGVRIQSWICICPINSLHGDDGHCPVVTCFILEVFAYAISQVNTYQKLLEPYMLEK